MPRDRSRSYVLWILPNGVSPPLSERLTAFASQMSFKLRTLHSRTLCFDEARTPLYDEGSSGFYPRESNANARSFCSAC